MNDGKDKAKVLNEEVMLDTDDLNEEDLEQASGGGNMPGLQVSGCFCSKCGYVSRYPSNTGICPKCKCKSMEAITSKNQQYL